MAHRMPRRGFALVSGIVMALLLGACDFSAPATPATPPPTAAETPAANGESPGATPDADGESRQLVLWLPEFFNPAQDTNAGAVLEGAFFQFEQNHPGLSLDVQIKPAYGQTGTLNYLRAAQRVAPTILPDLVLVHSSQLWQIVDLGIIPALEAHEQPAADLYFPFSLAAATYRGQIYGFPYAANILHGVMRDPDFAIPGAEPAAESAAESRGDSSGDSSDASSELNGESTAESATALPLSTPAGTPAADVTPPAEASATDIARNLPATWDDLLASELVYAFPAGAIEGSRLDSAVMHYLAAGGTLVEDGAAVADADALETYFEFLVLARRNNLASSELIGYADYESLWNAFSRGTGDLALMSAQNLLLDPESMRYIFLPVPTAQGEAASIGNVWAFAVLTRDENRRTLALKLINSLLDPEIQGAWSQASLRVPTQPGALERWGGQSDYIDFLQAQMNNAQAVPAGRPFADFARRLHTAQAGLLQNELTVDEAILSVRATE
ncbi:MAG: hypothetical protein WDZ49_13900 [Litorilinea sp.]